MAKRRKKDTTPSWYWYADWLYISFLFFLLGAMIGFFYGIEVACKYRMKDTRPKVITEERESDDVLQAEEDQYYPVRSQDDSGTVDGDRE